MIAPASNRLLVLGVGNVLRRDDGIGPAIIEVLKKINIPNVDCINGGVDGLALLDIIMPYRQAVIVDAINMVNGGGAESEKMPLHPGACKMVTAEEAKIVIQSDALSTHGFGLAEVLALMAQLNVKTDVTIFGVQPADIGWGEELSQAILKVFPDIMKQVKKYVLCHSSKIDCDQR